MHIGLLKSTNLLFRIYLRELFFFSYNDTDFVRINCMGTGIIILLLSLYILTFYSYTSETNRANPACHPAYKVSYIFLAHKS